MTLLKVTDFATQSGVPDYTLRRWDDQGVLIPHEVDAKSGYRLYHPDQVALAKGIRFLQDQGLEVKTVAEILQMTDLTQQKELLDGEIERWRQQAMQQLAAAQVLRMRALQLQHFGVKALDPHNPQLLPPPNRIAVAVLGLQAGSGCTSTATSIASMLCALGREVAVVEMSAGTGVHVCRWAQQAAKIGDPLPYEVYPLHAIQNAPAHFDLVLDTVQGHQSLEVAASHARQFVFCAHVAAGSDFGFMLDAQLEWLTQANIDVHSPNFAVLFNQVIVKGNRSKFGAGEFGEGLADFSLEDYQWYAKSTEECLSELRQRNLRFLGVIPDREVHRSVYFTNPRDFSDHHPALGTFLGVKGWLPPDPPENYRERLTMLHDRYFELSASKNGLATRTQS